MALNPLFEVQYSVSDKLNWDTKRVRATDAEAAKAKVLALLKRTYRDTIIQMGQADLIGPPMPSVSHLVQGDPLFPAAGDVIAQISVLNVGEPVPEGWRVLTGNSNVSKIARVVLRCEVE